MCNQNKATDTVLIYSWETVSHFITDIQKKDLIILNEQIHTV